MNGLGTPVVRIDAALDQNGVIYGNVNGILLISSIVIIVNLTVDVLYGSINPRIRHGR